MFIKIQMENWLLDIKGGDPMLIKVGEWKRLSDYAKNIMIVQARAINYYKHGK